MAKSHTVEVQIDKIRNAWLLSSSMPSVLAGTCCLSLSDIAGFFPVFLEMPEQVQYQVMRRKRHGKVPDIHQHDPDFRRGCFDIRFERTVTFLEWKPERSTG
ncbi:hypothetical protein ACTVRX_27190 [Klebsiella pneumoniae]